MEGFVFLGMRIQRHQKRDAAKRYVYTYPSRAGLAAVKSKVRIATRGTTNQSLSELLHHLNQVLRGWTNYHRHGAASQTFSYLTAFTWRRVWIWLRRKHPKARANDLRRRYYQKWHPEQDGVRLFYPDTVAIVRYRYRGAAIPSPWATKESASSGRHGHVESRMRGQRSFRDDPIGEAQDARARAGLANSIRTRPSLRPGMDSIAIIAAVRSGTSPARPRDSLPMNASSNSTTPQSSSRSDRTIARRSLCIHAHAVS